MIELDKLVLENFISHKYTEIDMQDLQGLIMVDGHNIGGKYDSNGAGKSTILESIVYTLSGNTLRKMGVNGMVNRKVGKNTRTHATLKYKGKTIEIDRHRKHDTLGDSILLKEDGVDTSKRLNKETQAEIDSLLGMSYRVLTNTIFLGEGLSSKFTQLSDGDKKSLIESTLNLAYDFNKSRDEANAKLKVIRDNLATSKGRITSLEGVLADLDRTALTAKVADLSQRIQGDQQAKSQLDTEYSTKYATYQDSNNRKVGLTSERGNVTSIVRQQETVMNHVGQLKAMWKQAGDTGACVVCKQTSADAVHNAQAHYANELRSQASVLEDLRHQVGSMRSLVDIDADIADVDQVLSSTGTELQSLQQQIQVLVGNISRMTSELSSSQDLLDNADKYEKEVSDLQDKVKDLEKQEKIYAYWYAAFSPTGLLVKVLEEAVDYLNDRIQIYSEMLLDRKYRLELGKGKLSLVDDEDASYETLSNGEKRRLDLAIQFGLHDYVHTYCGIQIDTLFIDEVLDTLDAVGISNIIDILRIKLSYCNLARIFVITHNQDLKSYFDRVLLVSKDKHGYSTLQVI